MELEEMFTSGILLENEPKILFFLFVDVLKHYNHLGHSHEYFIRLLLLQRFIRSLKVQR